MLMILRERNKFVQNFYEKCLLYSNPELVAFYKMTNSIKTLKNIDL